MCLRVAGNAGVRRIRRAGEGRIADEHPCTERQQRRRDFPHHRVSTLVATACSGVRAPRAPPGTGRQIRNPCYGYVHPVTLSVLDRHRRRLALPLDRAPSTPLVALLIAAAVLAATKLAGAFLPELGESPLLHIAGGVGVLLVPIVAAYTRRALKALGPEVLLAAAFYLSMYHAPLRRLLLASEALAPAEVRVLSVATWASFAVAAVVTLRPGAFEAVAARGSLEEHTDARSAQVHALAGLGAALLGYGLFAIWVSSVGIGPLLSANYNEVYLLASGQTSVTFQWPFMVGGIVATARAFALWPGRGPSTLLWCVYAVLTGLFVAITARLGVRGPILEIAAAIYLVRADTPRPVTRRAIVVFAVLFSGLFFFVSAMRGNLGAGVAATSSADVATQAQSSVSGDEATEFDAVFDNNVMITELAGRKLPFLDGQTYFDIPLQLIPRQIVETKPMGLSAWWIEYVDPDAARRGAGRAFGSFAEGYLNFAEPGAVGQVLAVTLFLMALFPLLRARSGGIAAAAAVILAHSYHCHRSEAIGVLFFSRNVFIVGLTTLLAARLLAAFDARARARGPGPPDSREPLTGQPRAHRL